jgi:hypothetical protein
MSAIVSTAKPSAARTPRASCCPVGSPRSAGSLLASSVAMRRDSASCAWRSSLPANAASAPSSVAVAAEAWRPIRSASGCARDALAPVRRFSARAPTCWATATLSVRDASSVDTVWESAVEAAIAMASRFASRSRRSARRAVLRLTPRARRAPRDDAHDRQRLFRAFQHARQV